MVAEHDKVEHPLPNGDILIVDSNRVDDETVAAFDALRKSLRDDARKAYLKLRAAAKPA